MDDKELRAALGLNLSAQNFVATVVFKNGQTRRIDYDQGAKYDTHMWFGKGEGGASGCVVIPYDAVQSIDMEPAIQTTGTVQ